MPFRAVLFDLDGVLVCSEPMHEEAAVRVLEAHALPCPDDLFDRMRGRPDRDQFAYVLEHADAPDVTVETLLREKEVIYADLVAGIEPVTGLFAFLEHLINRSVPRACVTSATRADQQAVFSALGAAPYFDAVITADDVTHGKPDPEPYRSGAAALGIDPADSLVLEDAPHGIDAATAAGCTPVGFTTTYPADALRSAGAVHTVATHSELMTWLEDTGEFAAHGS